MLRGSKRQQRLIAALSLLAIAGGVVLLCRQGRLNPEQKAAAMHRHSGAVLAQLIRQAVGPSGRLLLVTPDMTGMGLGDKARWMTNLTAAFEQALPAGLTVAGRETAVLRPARSTGRMAAGEAFTLGTYRDMLQRHPGVQGVVSLAGEPLGPVEAPANGAGYPPLVCFCFVGAQVPALMRQGIVTAAIVPRNVPTPYGKVYGDWFDIMYQVVTPTNWPAAAAR